jgi:hypothetical protein
MIILIYFTSLHFNLLLNNLTTIDYVEKEKEGGSKTRENFYDLGIYRNISSVMGFFIFWLLPIGIKT